MISTSPRLPELSFTQGSLFNSHLQSSESPSEHPSTPGALFSPTDAHAKQPPLEPIDPVNGNFTPPKNKQSSRKPNPLVDLVQTEETYVTMLSVIIRKVAAAWTKTNLPPKELDAMFRGIEVVFKANRRLLSQLKEIGQDPSNSNSAKALGDLLMNWIVDLDKPYNKFANSYMTGFSTDSWTPIASNNALPSILQALTVEYPPDSFSPSPISSWSLDSLFMLPRSRLKYYRKLYTRLIKSTEAGRSDHNLLMQAVQKLDALLDVLAQRVNITVCDEESQTNLSLGISKVNTNPESALVQSPSPPPLGGNSSELHTPNRPPIHSTALNLSIVELEQKLSTEGVLDLFTLKPRPVQLQLVSSVLPFTRTIVLSKDVDIYFTPKSLPESVQSHPQGCLFLLTDLLLLCERVRSETDINIKLLYPPLAAKHLRVSEPSSDNVVLQITVLKKETITLRLKTLADRDHLLKYLNKCIEASSALTTRRNQSPPPPVPPLKPLLSESTSSPSKSQSIASPVVDNISIGRLSLNHTANQSQALPENNNVMLSHDRPVLVANSKRASVLQPPQLPTFQTDFTSVQHPSPHDLYIPPPRGASNLSHSNSQFSGSNQPNLDPAHNHFHPNVTLHGRSLTPSLPHMTNQQLGPNGGGEYLSSENPMLRKSVSTTFLNGSYNQQTRTPSLRMDPPDMYSSMNPPPPEPPSMARRQSRDSYSSYLPQSRLNSVAIHSWNSSYDNDDTSPVGSPSDGHRFSGPIVSSITAQFKCKVFLKLQHGQWKSLGSARLKLYLQQPTNVKQLVVESESKDKQVLISTIVLTDGVERVGKTGVAIELSDKGARTGIVYLIQLRNEDSATGLFDSLLVGSDRAASRLTS